MRDDRRMLGMRQIFFATVFLFALVGSLSAQSQGPTSSAADWEVFWQTVVLGAVGLLQLVAFIFQARYMRAATKEMRETTAATVVAATATKDAAADNIKYGHQIERAYISGGGGRSISRKMREVEEAGRQIGTRIRSVEIVNEDIGQFEFHVSNYGKTRGRIYQIGWGFCEEDKVPPGEPVYKTKFFNSWIDPGRSGLAIHQIEIPPNIKSPAVYGRVYYETIFHECFSSGFLYRIPTDYGSESIFPPDPRYTDEREEHGP